MRNTQVTLKDIAEASGVALTTVSAALNGTGRVSETLRERIEKIAHRMNYEPNIAAKLLKQKKCRDIGLVISDEKDSIAGSGFLQPMLVKFIYLCEQEGIRCQVEFFNPAKRPGHLPELMTSGLAGGILHCGYVSPAVQEYMRKNPSYPLVAIEEECVSSVISKTADGVYNAIQHLAALGHERFAALLGPQEFNVHSASLEGFRRAVRDFSLDSGDNESWITFFEQYGDCEALEYGIAYGKNLFRMEPRPSALITSDGRIARGIIHAAYESGMRIPDDLSIMTIFSPKSEAEQTWPSLSTVSRNLDDTFLHAFRMLRALMNGRTPAESTVYTMPTLEIRNSICRWAGEKNKN